MSWSWNITTGLSSFLASTAGGVATFDPYSQGGMGKEKTIIYSSLANATVLTLQAVLPLPAKIGLAATAIFGNSFMGLTYNYNTPPNHIKGIQYNVFKGIAVGGTVFVVSSVGLTALAALGVSAAVAVPVGSVLGSISGFIYTQQTTKESNFVIKQV